MSNIYQFLFFVQLLTKYVKQNDNYYFKHSETAAGILKKTGDLYKPFHSNTYPLEKNDKNTFLTPKPKVEY